MLVLALALAFGLVAAAAIASGAFRKTRRARILRFGACAAGIIVLGCMLMELDLRFNFTPSTPLGIYRLMSALPGRQLPRGTLVAVCAPLVAAELGRRRGYLAAGRCSAGAELLLKRIVAVGGDDVTISANGVSVNGCVLPHSRQLAFDVAGRRLSRWREGHYRLRSGQLWLYGATDRSWDSRYWGPTTEGDVAATAVPLWTIPQVLPSTNHTRRCDARVELLHSIRGTAARAHASPPLAFR